MRKQRLTKRQPSFTHQNFPTKPNDSNVKELSLVRISSILYQAGLSPLWDQRTPPNQAVYFQTLEHDSLDIFGPFLAIFHLVMRKTRHKSNQPEATYHITSRMVQQRYLLTHEVKESIVEPVIRHFAKVYYIAIESEVEMTNHGHGMVTIFKPPFDYQDVKSRWEFHQTLLARPRKWVPGLAQKFYKRITDLSWLMRDIKWRISWLFNRTHDTRGHLWDGRFKSLEVKGEKHKGIVDSYIQQNPVKAKMAEKPSEYPYGTAGRIKAAMDRGETVKAPEIGVFAAIKDRLTRCKAYIAYHDYIAYLLRNPKARIHPPPPEVVALAIPSENWTEVVNEIERRGPVQWSHGVYEEKNEEEVKDSPSKDPPADKN